MEKNINTQAIQLLDKSVNYKVTRNVDGIIDSTSKLSFRDAVSLIEELISLEGDIGNVDIYIQVDKNILDGKND
jgi:hypothetical protein|tara:strand:+ start:213 stop:434 length:222 start_codon:yes stop_codon:yes gene_type:complete